LNQCFKNVFWWYIILNVMRKIALFFARITRNATQEL